MSSSNTSLHRKKRRGRRPGAKIPCDKCIEKASQNKDTHLELCETCTSTIHLARRKPSNVPVETAGAGRRMRRQSHAIIDTALGIRTDDQPTMPWSSNLQEQHALQFFITHSAPQLAGYFDSPFWQKMVLQAGKREPSVMHAIAAIGALHEKLLTSAVDPVESQDRRTSFALEQCNKSIRHLLKTNENGGKPNLRLVLTTCVLFTCFEALQGNCQQAIMHSKQGYNLLQQYAMDPQNDRWDAGAFAVEFEQLSVLMLRLRTQSKGLIGKDCHILPDAEILVMDKPTFFSDLLDARSSLERVLNQLTLFFLDLELDDHFYDMIVTNGEKILFFTPWLKAWETAFSHLLARSHCRMASNEWKGAMCLKAHHLVAEILAEVDLSLGELGWDVFRDKFEAIVNLAAAVLAGFPHSGASATEATRQTGEVSISPNPAALFFSLGIVDPLYEVVTRCRDLVLRKRALDLLATHPRPECIWSSWSAWKVGRFLIRLEEEGEDPQTTIPSNIPSSRRSSEAFIDFGGSPGAQQADGGPWVGYKRALPRATARYALNPGLFQWRTDEPDFIPQLNFATVVTTVNEPGGS